MNSELLKRIEDLISRTERKNILAHTSFLDAAESAEALLFMKRQSGASYIFSGGFPDAERKMLFILPDYIEAEFFTPDEYISPIRVSHSFGELTHRDYLGSLMGLGIKRETLGDILVFEDRAYIICAAQISDYILTNLEKIGRVGVSCESCPLSEIEIPEPVFDEMTGTVASLRADALTSLAFGISRTSAADMIRDGRLSLNHIELLNPAEDISEGDLLSLRGFGRAKLAKVGGTSKKGRQFITFNVFSKK